MTDIRYISTKEAAGIMGLSTRRVVGLCNAGKLEGALRKGRNWMVPEETVYAYLGTAKSKEENGEILSCAVGNTSYMDVVKNSYYVDKTLLIRDLIDDQVPVILFTRPRRFGKTLALDMLKTFLKKRKRIHLFILKINRFGHAVKNIRRCKGHFR
ncbi:MAG: AAA family ATPase [Anaerobutyricum soehngenii]